MWPLSACYSASAYKISPKSDNQSMSYGQKSEFQDGGRRHVEFYKMTLIETRDVRNIFLNFCSVFEKNSDSVWNEFCLVRFKKFQFLVT